MLNPKAKNIFCLESLWDSNNIEERLSVLPILEVMARMNDLKFVHFSCNTIPEFEYNIKLISRKKTYKILYLAFHGRTGKICFADESELSLDKLAEIMKDKFQGWIIHFGSCDTLKAKNETLQEFVEKTNASVLTGYTKTVDWAESAALEILILRYFQKYKNMKHLQNYLQKTFPDLIEVTGLKFFHKTQLI